MGLFSTDIIFASLLCPSEIISEGQMEVILDCFESVVRFLVDHSEKPIGDIDFINRRAILEPVAMKPRTVLNGNGSA